MRLSELLILSVLCGVVRLQNKVYYGNSTINWPGENVTNRIFDQSSNSYINVTDNGYGKVNIKTFANIQSFPGSDILIQNTDSFELMSNDYFSFNLLIEFKNISENFIPNSSRQVILTLNYEDTEGKKTIVVVLSVSWFNPTYDFFDINKTESSNSNTLKLKKRISNNNEIPWLQADKSVNRTIFSEEIDVNDLLQKIKNYGWAKSDPVLKYVGLRFQSNKLQLNYDFNFSKSLTQKRCCELSTITLSNRSVSSQVLQNVISPNYCKIFLNGSELSQVIFGFNFQSAGHELKSYQFVAFGYLNNKWVTPVGSYLLPMLTNKKTQINVNFSFDYNESISQSNTTVCFTIILRDDYNQINKSFNLNRTQPSAEILVCPWWRTAKIELKREKIIRLPGEQFYGMYVSSGNWPIFTFISLFPVDQQVKNFNLKSFVSGILSYSPDLSTHHIACIQMGFRVFSGAGTFSIRQSAVELQVLKQQEVNGISAECIIASLGKEDNNYQGCQAGSFVYSVVNQIMTIPNFGMILKMVSVLRLVDDLTYFAYHIDNYDQRFRGLIQLAWNLTSSKWIIPQIAPVYQRFKFTYRPTLSPDPTFFIPESYVKLGEDANFLRQTEDFWISSLPMTIATFVIFHCLFVLLRRFRLTKKLSSLFKRFHWFGFLTIAVIGDNIQYMSFRCFSQAYQLLPLGKSQLFTITLAYISFFLVLSYSACSYFLLPSFFAKQQGAMTEGYKSHFKTAIYFTGVSLLKICAGVAHSLLYKISFAQIVMLLFIQIMLFCLLMYARSLYSHKSLFFCHLFESIVRIVLHFILAIEVYKSKYKNFNKHEFSEITLILVGVIFGFCVIDLILSNIIEADFFERAFKYIKQQFILHRNKNRTIRKIKPQNQQGKMEGSIDCMKKTQIKCIRFQQPNPNQNFDQKKTKCLMRHKYIKDTLKKGKTAALIRTQKSNFPTVILETKI